jgi:putative modified peptide
MSDAVLTNDQTLKLLRELASNPGFRQRYEEKPAAALLEIGIPATTIANLPAACLRATPLKMAAADFQEAERSLASQDFGTMQSMIIPNVRVR